SVAAANEVSFNSTLAVVSSSPSSTISTTVPANAASGKIKVKTAGGMALSSTDFVVPFGSYAASDVLSTTRATVDGSAVTISVPTANKVGMVLFDGVQGQKLGFAVASVTYSPTTFSTAASVYVFRPDNVALVGMQSLA